ncbi:MAG: enhanced intracellular survival protein Eis, partial [Candidatus Thorarchaeota archaeon]
MSVRKATLKDFDRINELNGVCYGYDPISLSERMLKRFEITYDENYCIEADGKIVANIRNVPLEQNIRGKWLKMGGVAMVVSDPEYRRKGYVRDIMNYLLELMYEEDYSVSTLYPFKDTFYASYGYVNTPPTYRMEFNPNFLNRWKNLPPGYTVKRLSHIDGFNIYKEIYSKAMDTIHGGVKRPEKRWKEYDNPSPVSYAVAFNADGKPEGVFKYYTKGYSSGFDWSEDGKMTITEFWSLTPKARQSLYNFIFLYSDQIVKVILPLNPHESELYTWMQGYFITAINPINIWMARLVNIKTTLDNMKSSLDGSIKIRIIDEQITQNNQTFGLTSDKHKFIVDELGDKKADVEMTIQGLSSLVYGLLPAADIEAFNWIKNSSKE